MLLRADDIKPVIRPDPERGELGVFNPGGWRDPRSGTTYLLYRVADRSKATQLALARLARGDDRFETRLPVTLEVATGDAERDAFVRSALGRSTEDARYLTIPGDGGLYVSLVGLRYPPYSTGQVAVTVLATVHDDHQTLRVVKLLTPDERDDRGVVILPQKVGDQYVLLSRPQRPHVDPDPRLTRYVDWYSGRASCVYYTRTTDLTRRPDDRPLIRPVRDWERSIGGVGPQPILLPGGKWLVIYVGKSEQLRYSVGAAVVEHDPTTFELSVVARTPDPIVTPNATFNRRYPKTSASGGFGMSNVIFPETCLLSDHTLIFYVGCNDRAVGEFTVPLKKVLDSMDAPPPG
jgi:predicted GH43/DUF377 family glycosyl hydrolase